MYSGGSGTFSIIPVLDRVSQASSSINHRVSSQSTDLEMYFSLIPEETLQEL